MQTRTVQRVGGICGLVGALVLIPGYVAGVPDASSRAAYEGQAMASVIGNAVPVIIYVPLFLVFLVALYRRCAEVKALHVWSALLLVSGGAYLVLVVTGTVSEVSYPSAVTSQPGMTIDAGLLSVLLKTASWFYIFSQVALAVLIVVCGYSALRLNVFPRWLGIIAVIAVVVILTRGAFPLAASIVTPIWIGLLAIAMITHRSPSADRGPVTAKDQVEE